MKIWNLNEVLCEYNYSIHACLKFYCSVWHTSNNCSWSAYSQNGSFNRSALENLGQWNLTIHPSSSYMSPVLQLPNCCCGIYSDTWWTGNTIKCLSFKFILQFVFSVQLFVGSAWSFFFFIPATTANDPDFEGFSIPDFVHYIYFPILILEKEAVFYFLMFSAKQGNYWYHFYNVFDMKRSLTGDWTRDLPHSMPALYH